MKKREGMHYKRRESAIVHRAEEFHKTVEYRNYNKNIGERFWDWRSKNNFSLEVLAQTLNVDKRTLYRFETGCTPIKLKYLIKLKKLYLEKIDLNYLILNDNTNIKMCNWVNYDTSGALLKKWRQDHSLKVYELSEIFEVDPKTIWAYEHGKSCPEPQHLFCLWNSLEKKSDFAALFDTLSEF